MSTEYVGGDDLRRTPRYQFDRHTADYRTRFLAISHEMHALCPVAWTDTCGGHWVIAGADAVFELARCPHVSNDHDIHNERLVIEASRFRR